MVETTRVPAIDPMTADGAYALGMLWADGCLYSRGISKYPIRGDVGRPLWTVSVTTQEEETAQTMQRIFQTTTKLNTSTPEGYKPRWQWRSHSTDLGEALRTRGMTPRKSLTLTLPHIEEEFRRDFVRGYLDGDGSWHFDVRGKVPSIRCTFSCANKQYLVDLWDWLPTSGGSLGRANGAFQLTFCKKESLAIGNWIYYDGSTSLTRKRKIFEEGRELAKTIKMGRPKEVRHG